MECGHIVDLGWDNLPDLPLEVAFSHTGQLITNFAEEESPYHSLVLEEGLGQGAFGKVFRARMADEESESGWTTVAIKVLRGDWP